MIRTRQEQAALEMRDRRAEPRSKAGHSVLLRTPDAHPAEACLLDVSSRGARLRVPGPVPIGETVTIEAQDVLLSGSIKRCTRVHGAYEVGIALSFPLELLGELRKLNAALSAESEPVY
jgi:hypothetical protein